MVLELVIAMGLLLAVLMPIAFSFLQEQKLCRAYYYRAIVMQLIDGELEILRAGEWKAFEPGTHRFQARGRAATNLPPGEFRLVLSPPKVRLEWVPAKEGYGGTLQREVLLPPLDSAEEGR